MYQPKHSVESEIKTSLDIQMLEEVITSTSVFQEMLKFFTCKKNDIRWKNLMIYRKEQKALHGKIEIFII